MRRGFGEQVFNEDGKIDRQKLSNIIFQSTEKRMLLNKLSHPRIFRKILVQLFKLRLNKRPMIVLDAPLLFETKILEYFCYPIIVVYCDDSQKQVQRLTDRNQISEQEAMKKISSQMPVGLKQKKADILVDNSGSKQDLNKLVTSKIIP